MKGVLVIVLAFCLALGVAGGMTEFAPSAQHCPARMAHCPSHKSGGGDRPPTSPCTASCPICANAGTASLNQSELVRVTWVTDRRPADAAWLAEAVVYPPPLPPPRAEAS